MSPSAFFLALLAQTSPALPTSPVDVDIAFHVIDFARITPRDESFDVTGYLELTWRDPSRRGPYGRVDPKREWVPTVWFENALEQPRFHGDPIVEAWDDGSITSWVIVSAKLSTAMDLRRFPFDRQVLHVRIAAMEDLNIMRLALGPDPARVDPEAFVSDWSLGTPSARIDTRNYVPDGEPFGRFHFTVPIRRQSTFYVWRVMVPLTILALVAWASFWFEPVGLQPQISTCMAALIALVAFNFAVDFSMPKLPYLTVIDTHALIGYAFVAAAVVAVTVIHRAVVHGRMPLALAIQGTARRAFLPAYALAVLLNLAAVLGWGSPR